MARFELKPPNNKGKLKVLFRTAGGTAYGKQLGLGHVFRCINLARELHNYEIFFLIEDYGGVKEILEKNGYKNIKTLKKNITLKNDFLATKSHIEKNKINLIIIDKYKIKFRFVERISKIVKTVIITDLKKINYKAHLLINGFIGFKNQKTINAYGTRCLLGPSYQIIDQKFRKLPTHTNRKFDLLATFGGFDEKNISKTLFELLSSIDYGLKVKMVLGPATKLKIQNNQRISNNKIVIVNEVKNMKKEISNSKFGICSGGITTYEFASIRVPFAIICQNSHQLITANEWQKRKIAFNLGKIGMKTKRNLDSFLRNYSRMKNLKIDSPRLVDGFGSHRVAKEIISLAASL